jgi:hypothetical protein
MKQRNKEKLQQDLIKYSKQIGILDNEVPKLVLDRKQMRSLVYGKIYDSKRIGGWGECFCPIRTIFVDAGSRLKGLRDKQTEGQLYLGHFDADKRRWIADKALKTKRNYRDYQKVLVHELVHYRFPYLRHGKKYEQRVREILRGRPFEPKHVYLFAHVWKKYRENIDANPT